MPAKNIVKTYVADGYYHIYNRGVEKRLIFLDEQDYKVFLRFLKDALSPPPTRDTITTNFTLRGVTFKGVPKQPKNFNDQLELLAYCLMPNHFHLLVKQLNERSIHEFMHSISTRYSIYFNKKYKRVGKLFQNAYKAALITDDPYLLHLSLYIHRNPLEHIKDLKSAYSSYAEYLKLRHTPWINSSIILSYFSSPNNPNKYTSYQSYVEKYNKQTLEEDELLAYYLDD